MTQPLKVKPWLALSKDCVRVRRGKLVYIYPPGTNKKLARLDADWSEQERIKEGRKL